MERVHVDIDSYLECIECGRIVNSDIGHTRETGHPKFRVIATRTVTITDDGSERDDNGRPRVRPVAV